ncbi:MAG: hypothetical protein AAGA77_16385 [Bacteroidota bacterium]
MERGLGGITRRGTEKTRRSTGTFEIGEHEKIGGKEDSEVLHGGVWRRHGEARRF